MAASPEPRDFEEPPMEARLSRCHALSDEAFRHAARATSDYERASYISLGMGWRALARETERMLQKLRPGDE